MRQSVGIFVYLSFFLFGGRREDWSEGKTKEKIERKSCCWRRSGENTEDESRLEGIEGESAVKRREEWTQRRVASALAAQPVPSPLSRKALRKVKGLAPNMEVQKTMASEARHRDPHSTYCFTKKHGKNIALTKTKTCVLV